MDPPWNGDPCVFTLVQKLFQFSMDWGWKVGAKFRKAILFAVVVNQGFAEFQCDGCAWNSGKPWIVLCFVF